MASKVALALMLAMMAIAVYAGHHGGHHGVGHHGGWGGWDSYAHPHYKYSYGVNDKHTWDQKHASEWRDGSNVGGQYSLREPDGSWRTVTYWADKGGFRANVHRTPNHHPHGWSG